MPVDRTDQINYCTMYYYLCGVKYVCVGSDGYRLEQFW